MTVRPLKNTMQYVAKLELHLDQLPVESKAYVQAWLTNFSIQNSQYYWQ